MIAIGIGAHEVNAINAGLRHLIDRVATAATDADDANDRSPTLAVSEFKNFPCLSAHVLAPAPSRRSSVRSEEHTSELQSLMSISYAVFCLKKNRHKLHT